MKKMGKFLGIIAFTAIIGFSMAACDHSAIDDLDTTDDYSIIPVTSRFLADSYTGQNRIKFEFRYGDYDFFYIYLGQLRVIPLFNFPTQRHSGFESTYQATLSEQIVETVSQAVTNSSQVARSIAQTHRYTRTAGGSRGRSLSVEINAGFTVGNFSAGGKVTGTTSWNEYWNNSVTHGGSTTVQATTSRTDTLQYATSKAISTVHSRTFPLTRNMPVGYYRYTMFGVSDVYLLVVRNSSGEIHYEFREHIIPDSHFWDLNFCATNTFGKNDSSHFELDISILEGLRQRPRPKLDFTGTTPPPSLSL